MQLFFNRTSPYARMVRVAAHETGMFGRLVLREVDPWSDPDSLHSAAPLGRVPALITADGRLIAESTEICRYLDGLDALHRLQSAEEEVMARTALAHGAIDSAFAIVLERRRPASKQWSDWIERQELAIRRTLPHLVISPMRFDLGDLTTSILLAYLDFRLNELGWRDLRPELSGPFAIADRRPSMAATAPEEGPD